jgi:alpha-L-fucosidase 2
MAKQCVKTRSCEQTTATSFAATAAAVPSAAAVQLRYTRPAGKWTEALPLGNGRLGVMVFGGILTERLQLNEAILWSGTPREWNNPDGPDGLAEVRKAVFAGDYPKADQLCRKMQGPFNESYQPLGDLTLDFTYETAPATPAHIAATPAPAAYERTLDMDRTVATTRFAIDGVTYTREIFSSYPDQLIVVRLTASQPGKLNVTLTATGPFRHTTTVTFTATAATASTTAPTLLMRGRTPSHIVFDYKSDNTQPIVYDEGKTPENKTPEGMTFALDVRIHETDGAINAAPGQKSLSIERATTITLLLGAATSFNGSLKSPGHEGRDPLALAAHTLDAAKSTTCDTLLSRHVADHQILFRRATLRNTTPATTTAKIRHTTTTVTLTLPPGSQTRLTHDLAETK